MYRTNITHASGCQKILETGSRLLQYFTLSLKAASYKKKADNETFAYFLGLIKKRAVLFDITSYKDDNALYLLLGLAKRAEKVVAFESDTEVYNCLLAKTEILKWKNVAVERLSFFNKPTEAEQDFSFRRQNGALVIDFKSQVNRPVKNVFFETTIDKYCTIHHIKPDYLRISAEGNELEILNGAKETLQKHKPTILLNGEAKHAGRAKVLQTFNFLADLNYSGYFILDVMKIPVRNLDFNIYQNPLSNFYCKDFIFE